MEDIVQIQVDFQDEKKQKVQRLSRLEKKQKKYNAVKAKQLIQKKKLIKKTQEKFHTLSQEQKDKLNQVRRERAERKKKVLEGGGIEVFVDLEYDVKKKLIGLINQLLMQEREIRSLCMQIAHIVGLNQDLPNPIQLHLTNYKGVQQKEMEKQGALSWPAHKHEEALEDIIRTGNFRKEFIYLSPDAEEELETVDPEKFIYIIGGFVDRTVQKFMSYNKASALQISTAKLPINDFIKGRKRPLNIDTVASLLSEFVECKDWRTSYEKATSRNEGIVTKFLKEQTQQLGQQ